MKIEKLGIEGLWMGRSPILTDNRGNFREWFKSAEISEMTGKEFNVEQSNTSTSRRGVIRGFITAWRKRARKVDHLFEWFNLGRCGGH